MAKPWEKYQSGTGGQVFTLPQSPEKAAAEARQAAKDARDADDKAADNTRADESLKIQRETAESLNALRAVQLQAEQEKAQQGKARSTTLQSLAKQIDRVQELYESNVEGFNWNVPWLGGIAAGTEGNSQFDTSGAQLSSLGLAAFRVPGTGTVSDRDAIMFDRANMPSAGKWDSSIQEQLRGMRSRVDEELKGRGEPPHTWRGADGQQADDELDKATAFNDTSPPGLEPVNEPGGNDPTPWDGPNADMQTGAAGAFRFVDNPRARSSIASLINAGAGYSTVAAAAQKAGGKPLSLQEFNAVKSWMKNNPGKEYPASAVEAGEYVPLNLGQKIAGSPGGAFTAQMANAATAGTVGALAGERGKGALDAMAAMNPDASLAGSLVGGVTGALGAEIGLGARLAGTAAARFAPRIADAGFGAATGFNNAAEGEGLQDAALGALLAPIAGSLGERTMRGVGQVIGGVAAPAARRLREAGIPLTIGQVMGEGGLIGQGVKKIEDSLTSVPFVGNMVDARRMEGLEAFNRAAFQRAAAPGAPITATGAPGMAQVRGSVQDAYGRALDPVDLDVAGDAQLLEDITNAQFAAAPIPQGVGDNAIGALDYRVGGGIDPSGRMDGRDFQEAYRGLGRDRRTAADPYAHEFGQAMRGGQDALAEALERQQPGQFPQFLEANAANRRAEVLAKALNPNALDELITPAQLNRADFNSTSKLEGRINAASGNRPFYDLATDGQAVLPSRLPDSGTTTRALTGIGLTGAFTGGGAAMGGGEGAATGTGLGLGATLALIAGGSRPAQRAAVAALLDRPDLLRQLSGPITRNAQLGGGFGAGVLTPLLVGPQ